MSEKESNGKNGSENNPFQMALKAVARINSIFSEYPEVVKMITPNPPVLHAKIETKDDVSIMMIPTYELDALQSMSTLSVLPLVRPDFPKFPIMLAAEVARKVAFLESIMSRSEMGVDDYYYVRSDTVIAHPVPVLPRANDNLQQILNLTGGTGATGSGGAKE